MSELHHDDQTMRKVYDALVRSGMDHDQAMSAINEMQNAGILFRETARETGSRELPLDGQVFARVDFSASGYGKPTRVVENLADANLITSKMDPAHGVSLHRPVLDIDMPAKLIPSSTPGHFHLFIDKAMTWTRYARLLDALVRAGLVEEGFVASSKERGFTSVRLPWVRKGHA